ncbi:uncharacterized protein LOC135374432 [Ornithodoros turicata]|uniref:uncharacterized protein LOC135374432 n=1 Tax=Ornithodoros turicata TaxID=34597 RepID=UPI0031399396
MAEVRDIVINPPSSNPYDKLKEQLIKRLSESQQQRLRQLLTTEELGDRTPTQFLRRLYQLLGDESSALDESILKELFLQRLPQTVRMILSASASVPLRELSELVDRIMEATPSFVNHIPTTPTHSPTPPPTLVDPYSECALREEVQRLRSLVQSLTITSEPRQPTPTVSTSQLQDEIEFRRAQVSAISRRPPSTGHRLFHPSRPRSPSPRYRFPSRRRPQFQLCWYHARFGKATNKCEEPCVFQGNAGTDNERRPPLLDKPQVACF